MPSQTVSGSKAENKSFLEQWKSIVVKPVSQSLGNGISVDVTTGDEVERLIRNLKINGDEKVLLEQYIPGEDLRIIVINHVFIAAIHRQLPSVTGDGVSTVRALIETFNASRSAHNAVPFNFETERCIAQESCTFDSVPAPGKRILLRKNANEHTGGIAMDVTSSISKSLREVAEQISRIIDIPVVGIDFIVPSVVSDSYTVIEVNSRPGLDGHEPQPVVEAFLDYLFPELR